MRSLTFYILMVLCLSYLIPGSVLAGRLESERYRIEFFPHFLPEGVDKQEKQEKIAEKVDIAKDPMAVAFSKDGYFVRRGFPYITSIKPFRLSVEPLSLDLSTNLPGIPVLRNVAIAVDVGSSSSYQLSLFVDRQLTNSRGEEIAPTSCDKNCTINRSGVWKKAGSLGLGYNIKGSDAPADFVNENFYRPFPAKKRNQDDMVVMSGKGIAKESQANLTVKANLTSDQTGGVYTNKIYLIALPQY